MSKFTFVFTIFSGLMMMANVVMAGDKIPGQTDFPVKYQLKDVRISILHQTGHRIPGSYQINISGEGRASYTIDKKQTTNIILPNKTLIELLNDFYRIHFFELQDTYTIKRQIALVDDHSISTFSSRLVDMSSKRLCITLADYKKCVTIIDQQPIVANQLVDRIERIFRKTGLDK